MNHVAIHRDPFHRYKYISFCVHRRPLVNINRWYWRRAIIGIIQSTSEQIHTQLCIDTWMLNRNNTETRQSTSEHIYTRCIDRKTAIIKQE